MPLECLCALGDAVAKYCPEHGTLSNQKQTRIRLEDPDRLKGYGYRLADQDGGDGEEVVSPQRDFEETMIEAVKVLLDAREI